MLTHTCGGNSNELWIDMQDVPNSKRDMANRGRAIAIRRTLMVSAVVALGACRVGQPAHLSDPGGVRKTIEHDFLGIQGRFTEAHIETCLAERRKQGAVYSPIAKPIYQPNYFFTCVANTDVGTQKFLDRKPGHYSVAYEVRVPISKPAVVNEPNGPPDKQWFYWTRCNYAVEGDKIRFQEDGKVDVFIENVAVPGSGQLRHICMQMPNAELNLQSTRKNTRFMSIHRKPGA